MTSANESPPSQLSQQQPPLSQLSQQPPPSTQSLEIVQIPRITFINYRNLLRNEKNSNVQKKITNLLLELTISPSHSLTNLSSSSTSSSPATTPTTARRAPQFITDFSRASQQKKVITSYLNKLTETNKDNIFKRLASDIQHYSPDEISIALDQIFISLRHHKDTVEMYYDILCLFEKVQLQEYVNNTVMEKYIGGKEWLPPQEYQDNDVYKAQCEYDLYCSFSSWKNGGVAMCKFFAMYLDRETRCKLINLFLEDIYGNLSTRVIIDPVLEQLECIFKLDDKFDKEVISKLKKINKSDIPLSSYFKIQSFKNE